MQRRALSAPAIVLVACAQSVGNGPMTPSDARASFDSSASATCNDLVNDAPLVTVTASGAALPVGDGGTIVPGVYHLVSLVYYGTPRGRPGRQTILFAPTGLSQSVHDSGEGTTLRSSTIV